MKTIKLTPEQITAIEHTLSAGDRVELVPVKDGIKAMKLARMEIKVERDECLHKERHY